MLSGCIDLVGANAAFCAQRPDVCAADAAVGAGGGGGSTGGGAGGGGGTETDGGVDAGLDAGVAQLLRCDAPGLVAWWAFDEDAGAQLSDCSPHALHAQVSGTPFRVPGQHGLAFSFTGMNFAEVGNPTEVRLTGAMSISVWLRVATFAGSGRLVSKAGPGSAFGWELWSDSAQSRLAFSVAQSQVNSFTVGASVPLGQWVHVVATWSPSGPLSLYVDGALSSAIPGPATGFDTDAGVRLGARPDGCCHFVGLVDDLRIFDRALSPAEVTELSR